MPTLPILALDGGEDVEYIGVVFVEISKISTMRGAVFLGKISFGGV